MRPIDGSPQELQQFINAGDLLKPGDRVRIVTADQKPHRFAIVKIEAGRILGSNESLLVDQVISLEIENTEHSAQHHLDTKLLTDWLIAIGAFAMKPIAVESTRQP